MNPKGDHEFDYLMLVYLEDDPRLIEQLLQRSCASNQELYLNQAIKYCDRVGSNALRDYYTRRLNEKVFQSSLQKAVDDAVNLQK